MKYIPIIGLVVFLSGCEFLSEETVLTVVEESAIELIEGINEGGFDPIGIPEDERKLILRACEVLANVVPKVAVEDQERAVELVRLSEAVCRVLDKILEEELLDLPVDPKDPRVNPNNEDV